jgi:ketosteroid isomerase-like protein
MKRYRSPEEIQMPKEPPAEIMALINTALDAFNRKDSAVFNSVYGGDVVIVDGFAPSRWIGPGAQARWWADAETWGKAGGAVNEHISFEGIRYCEVSGTRAYAVLSATLTITLKTGAPIVRPGIPVYTFARQGDVWKAEGQMWGRLS